MWEILERGWFGFWNLNRRSAGRAEGRKDRKVGIGGFFTGDEEHPSPRLRRPRGKKDLVGWIRLGGLGWVGRTSGAD